MNGVGNGNKKIKLKNKKCIIRKEEMKSLNTVTWLFMEVVGYSRSSSWLKVKITELSGKYVIQWYVKMLKVVSKKKSKQQKISGKNYAK